LHTIQLDGTHTRTHGAVEGAVERVGYLKRKGLITINLLYLYNEQGILLAFSAVQSSHHHDLFDIGGQFERMLAQLVAIGIRLDGLILNADAALKRVLTLWK